jgi:LacI family transcriptional regulator
MVLNKGKQHNRVSQACAERVQAVARELGYVPNYHARSMKLGRAEVLAVAMDIGHEDEFAHVNLELADPYFSHLIGGIETKIRDLKYLMAIIGPDPTTRAPDRALMGVKQRRFDGIIVVGPVIRADMSNFLREPTDSPVVIIQPKEDTVHPTVVFNEAKGIGLAVQHLVDLGHRRIAYAFEARPDPQSEHTRFTEFESVCRKLGVGAEMIAPIHSVPAAGPEGVITTVGEAVTRAVAAGKFQATAVMAYNDLCAIGVIEGLQHARLSVPRDVSVIGFDDTLARYAVPRLTTVSHELPELGRIATELCVEMVGNPALIEKLRHSRRVVEPRLVIRHSTGPARPRA